MKAGHIDYTVSIENEEEMRAWVASVFDRAAAIQTALNDLSAELGRSPAVKVTVSGPSKASK